MQNLVNKLMRRTIQDKLRDKMREKKKEAKARIRETQKAAKDHEPGMGKRLTNLALGALGGAVLMYFLDPRGGGRRRALVRDKVVRLGHEGEGALGSLGAVGEQVKDRARGTMAEAQGRIKERLSDETVPNQQLEARVRSELGRFVKHLGAVDIRANDGVVTLSGPALADEVDDLVKTARSVRGVKALENRLTVFATPQDIPALQR